MIVLGIDPGALKMGLCSIELDDNGDITLKDQEAIGLPQNTGERVIDYLCRLAVFWNDKTEDILDRFTPDAIWCETPVIAATRTSQNNMQRVKAASAVVAFYAATQREWSAYHGIEWNFVAQSTYRAKLFNNKDASKSEVKAEMRVILPGLKVSVKDIVDASAVALYGVKHGTG